jgi:ADP-ribose 1''-phosphate phosphatase
VISDPLTEGDIFHAPHGTVIIHACNCVGSWGVGSLLHSDKNIPQAFEIYKDHCKESTPDELIRTALLIPPQVGDPQHFVACLFTSKKYGRGKDTAQQILNATVPSLEHLTKHMDGVGEEIKDIGFVRSTRACSRCLGSIRGRSSRASSWARS